MNGRAGRKGAKGIVVMVGTRSDGHRPLVDAEVDDDYGPEDHREEKNGLYQPRLLLPSPTEEALELWMDV